MALSKDDKEEIIELRGRGYSYRKIADRTGHSDTTVRAVVNEATEQVVALFSDNLELDKIAERLGYPLAFVEMVVAESKTKSTREPVAAISQLGKTAIGREWEEFQRQQEIERKKESLRKRVKAIKQDLARLDDHLRIEDLLDATWKDQRKSLDEQARFCLQKVDEINSVESLSELQDVVNKVAEASKLLCNDYRARVEESKNRRTQQEKKISDNLINKRIDVPWYPSFVKEYIKKKFTIKTEREATRLAIALIHIHEQIRKETDERIIKEIWDKFIGKVEEKGWDYITELYIANGGVP